MLAFDPDLPIKDAAKLMAEQAQRLQTLQVTLAVRDARIGRRRVHKGDYIVLGPNDGLVATAGDRTSAVNAGVATLNGGFELLTLYRGRDVDEAAAEELRDCLAEALEGVEVELVDGGQPHYDFLISAE
jgi:dihydroxyacetone kinase-like predicted kinase